LSASPRSSYGRGATILSIGIGVTGLVTYAYFALASHNLSADAYGRIALLWSTVFVIVSVLYRPVEQLLSRTIADRDARGQEGADHLRVAALIQLALAAAFAVAALLLRETIEDELFGGSSTLFWVLVATVLAYSASYFARGYLAGNRRYGLYGGLVLFESLSRVMFPLAVAVGIASGQNIVALGMLAAPVASLLVVPWALGRATSDERQAASDGTEGEFTLAHGTGFAAAVLLIMICEQTFLNAGPLLLKASENDAAIAGFAFNVLLIARAPLQLFQAVQTSILPHLTSLTAAGETDPFRRSVNATLAAIALFAATAALALLAVGPWVMDLLFGGEFDYARGGLALVAVGMGLYLAAATLNQAALARGHAKHAAACWLFAAAAFVVFLLAPGWEDRVLQLEVSYAGSAFLLCTLLYALYRRA
jgi:O-antigen/teichoic acid export membrane protein